MSEAYDSINEALNEALAFAHVNTAGAVVHHPSYPSKLTKNRRNARQ
jgi:hypothetical protein